MPSNYYYQIYQTKPISENIKEYDNSYYYEDDNCKVVYDFWSPYGTLAYNFYNKSDQDICINLKRCAYVYNGLALDCYGNRIYGSNKSENSNVSQSISFSSIALTSVSKSLSEMSSVYTIEDSLVIIPSQTYKTFYYYDITTDLFTDCSLSLYPNINKKAANVMNFSEDNTPITFWNIIEYSVTGQSQKYKIRNMFYINSIANYWSDDIIKKVKTGGCPGDSNYNTKTIKINSEAKPSCFYIRYLKESSFN